MQDEQDKKKADKLTYVHNVELLRNAGDLPSVQTRHRRGAVCQEQERQGNDSEEDSENTTPDDTQGFGKVTTFFFFLNVF
jgi:hypothetical protein